MKPSPAFMKLVLAIRAAGGTPYLVGGTVRDKHMWRASNDLDLEVYGLNPDTLRKVCEDRGVVNAVGKSFGVLKLKLVDDTMVDVSVPRTENKLGKGHRGFMVTPSPNMDPKAAAARRDFTMNALAMDPITGEMLDFFGGRDDLDHGILRATSEAFKEDPLRVLRGMQFAARFNMTADDYTVAMCWAMRDEYFSLPVERVWGEWQKWALGRFPSMGLRFLDRTSWYLLYTPFHSMMNTVQDKKWHPEGNVWTHTLHTVDAASMIAIREKLKDEDRMVLVFAALCHDMGKVSTTVVDLVTDRVTSPGHAEEGLFYAGKFLQQIGAPESISSRVLSLVAEHMWATGHEVTERSVRRLSHRLDTVGNTIQILAWLMEADNSGRPPLVGGMPPTMGTALALAAVMKVASRGPIPIVMGRHLIEMGFKPGPQFKAILDDCFQKQLDGMILGLEVGKAYVVKNYGGKE